MRALFVSNLFPPAALGGYEQICQDIALGLRDRGHQIDVCVSTYEASSVRDDRAWVHRNLWLSHDWDSRPNKLWQRLRRLAIELHNQRRIKDALSSFRPDITLIWNGDRLGRSWLWECARSSRVALFLSDEWAIPILRSSTPGPSQRAVRWLGRSIGLTLGSPPLVQLIFCSNYLRQTYAAEGVDVSDSDVIHHGVSLDSATRIPGGPRRASGTHGRVLFVGRISRDKGVNTLLRAFSMAAARLDSDTLRLTLVGTIGEDFRAITASGTLRKIHRMSRPERRGM